jgi:hypothetical protein
MSPKAFINAVVFLALLAGGWLVASCSSYNKDAQTIITECNTGLNDPSGCNTPSFNAFAAASGVGDMMIQRCGSLDCHGQVGRPLRLYGYGALRLPSDAGAATPLAGNTTSDEYQADFDAVVALQPEDLIRVVTGSQDANTLLLLLKPTNNLVHKGGPVLSGSPRDPGFNCLADWVTYQYNAVPDQNCVNAIYPPNSFSQ